MSSSGKIGEHDVNVLTDVAGSLGEVTVLVKGRGLEGWVEEEVLEGMGELLWGNGEDFAK